MLGLKDVGFFASWDKDELVAQITTAFIRVVKEQVASDKQKVKEQKTTLEGEKATLEKENATLVEDKAALTRQKEESDQRASDAKKKGADLKKKYPKAMKKELDLGAKVMIAEQNYQELQLSIPSTVERAIKEFKASDALNTFVLESDTLEDFRHDLVTPTFWKGIHVLRDYVYKVAGDFDFSRFRYKIDAPSESEGEEGSPLKQLGGPFDQ
ncbi:hypothetical protein NE237_010629 [Protea cynaroides]|uniref:Uncharacterized protein n=1 Tax=Protea cynaroides TaxID=273540 RepID=A0A9Q0L032_9MAGN|nr:hypothetical protein NE237_010629 [Protea cynaroides]